MIRGQYGRSIINLSVIFVLLFSIVYVSINATGSENRVHSAPFLKKPVSSSKSDTLLPEKVESENDHKPHLSFLYINPVDEVTHLNISQSLHTCFFNATRIRGNSSDLPLYLMKRSILI
ncbi:MAG: hypothetical protein ABJA70_11795 [Chryseolinea sp.]